MLAVAPVAGDGRAVIGEDDVAPRGRGLDAVDREAQGSGERVLLMPADLGHVLHAVVEEGAGGVLRGAHLHEPHREAATGVGVLTGPSRGRDGLREHEHLAGAQRRM